MEAVIKLMINGKLKIKGYIEKDLSDGDFVEYKLSDILDYIQPGPYIVNSTKYSNNYSTPVVTPGKTFILGYSNEVENIYEASKEPVIIFDDFTAASRYIDFDFKVKSSAMKILKNRNPSLFNTEFIYYYLQTISVDVSNHKRYWISKVSHIKVRIPKKEHQDIYVNAFKYVDENIKEIEEDSLYYV